MAGDDIEEVSEETIGLYDHPLIFYKKWVGVLRRAKFLKDENDIKNASAQVKKFQELRPEIEAELESDHSLRRK